MLDPNAFTIGFARRFATYKRATLLFRDVARLKRILLNKEMPVQLVIAGKAHPKDQPGKSFIREVVQFSRDPDLWKHVVFVEDYDMKVGREMVQGVDLWLNNPRRGEEACGTSGMKAAINGVLNLSILDGWFDEAYEHSGGWAIGEREPYSDDQDGLHASAIYYLLENEIVPMFYERREQTPREWMRRMKQSLTYITPHFDCRRMVHEYMTELYEPAHSQHVKLLRGDYSLVREKAQWNTRIREVWDRVRFVDSVSGPAGSVTSGKPVEVRAAIDLAGLTPGDVRVEVVMGRIDSNGQSGRNRSDGAARRASSRASVATFGKEIVPGADRAVGLCAAGQPESLRRSADPAVHEPAEVERRGGLERLLVSIEVVVRSGTRLVQRDPFRGTYGFDTLAGSQTCQCLGASLPGFPTISAVPCLAMARCGFPGAAVGSKRLVR